MAKEIERKFLVCGDYTRDVFRSTRIVQAYLNSDPGRTVRVRIAGDKAFITVKGRGRVSRFEWEKEIPVSDARELLELAEPGVIDKTRHLVRCADGSRVWEIDEFHGDNEDLTVAEIELSSEDERFDKPSWLGEEVSEDCRYTNSALKDNPFKSWKTR